MLHAVPNFKAVLRLIRTRAVASARGTTSERHELAMHKLHVVAALGMFRVWHHRHQTTVATK